MLNREIPFLRLVIPLIAGIVSGLWINPDSIFYILAGGIALILLCISLFYNNYLTNTIFGISFTLILFTCGLYLYSKEKNSIDTLNPEEHLYCGIIDDYPEEKAKTYALKVKLTSLYQNNAQKKVNGSILLYHRKDSLIKTFVPGDYMVFRFSPQEIVNRNNPCEFDYKFYMETQGIKYFGFTDSSDIIVHKTADRRSLKHKALTIRQRMMEMFRDRGIQDDRLAIIAAITLGQKNMLDEEQKQYFIKAGIMHIMAVSGLHAGIVSMFVMSLLFFLKGRFNSLRIIITMLTLWCFAFITGLTPSVLRATIMFSFLHTGQLSKRPVNGVNSVLASAFLILLFKPSVIFATGFQLSYLAVIYIIVFLDKVSTIFRFKTMVANYIWQSAAVTVIAQLGTLPLTITFFNRFPTWFILSNVLIIPIATVTLITGLMTLVTYPMAFLSGILSKILGFMTDFTEYLTAKAASMPYSTIENIGMTHIECILLLITIPLILCYLLNRKSMSPILPTSALLVFILAGTIIDLHTVQTHKLIVYNTFGKTAVGIESGKTLHIISDSNEEIPEVNKQASTLRLKVQKHEICDNGYKIHWHNKNIVIGSELSNSFLEETKPDIIIMANSHKRTNNKINYKKKIETVVIGNDVPLTYSLIKNINHLSADTVHFIKRQGAFTMNMW